MPVIYKAKRPRPLLPGIRPGAVPLLPAARPSSPAQAGLQLRALALLRLPAVLLQRSCRLERLHLSLRTAPGARQEDSGPSSADDLLLRRELVNRATRRLGARRFAPLRDGKGLPPLTSRPACARRSLLWVASACSLPSRSSAASRRAASSACGVGGQQRRAGQGAGWESWRMSRGALPGTG